MQPFVFSAVLTFLIYQCLVYVDIPPRRGWFRIGNINVNFDAASAKWAQRTLIVLITLAVVFGVLFLHEFLSPVDPISRDKTNIVLGFLFGPLFAIWLNSVFSYPPGQPLSRGLMIGGVGLILFCLIGSAGNQTGKLLQQLSRKISGVKGLGVEVSLSESSRKRDSSQGATSLAGSQGSPNFASSSGSAGLEYVSQLDGIVRRDKKYLKELFDQADVSLSDQLDRAEDLAKLAVMPPMKCLAAWLETNADATYVNDRLGLFVIAFRQVSTLNSDQRRTDVSRTFVRNLAVIASDVEGFGAPPAVESACAPLSQIFCSSFIEIGSDKIVHIADRPGLMECLRNASTRGNGPLKKPAEDIAEQLSEKLKLFVADDGLETRPYFAVAHASLMAQLGQYAAAAAILNGWLDRQKARSGDNLDVVKGWYEIRARSILAAYFEEWLLKQGTSAATAFRNEHLKNLGILRKSLEELLVKPGFLLKKASRTDAETVSFEVRNACGVDEVEARRDLWRQIFSSYISMELTHIQNRLRHPDYKLKYVESTNTDIIRLVNLDLSCLSKYPPPAQVYAQFLDSYALNMVQYVTAKKDTETTEDREKRLDAARRAVAYGLEITYDQAQIDLNRTGVAFLERVAPSDWVSARESLQQTGAAIRAAMDE
jgi:hypothetical protein